MHAVENENRFEEQSSRFHNKNINTRSTNARKGILVRQLDVKPISEGVLFLP